MEKCISIAKPFTLIICFIDITSKCVFNQGTFSQSRHEKSNCEAVLGEESVVVFFISLCDFTVSVNLQILRLLFLGSRASSSPDSTPQKTWAQPAGLLQLLLFFCTLLFNVKKKKHCLYGNCCGCGESICTIFLFPGVWCVGTLDKHSYNVRKWRCFKKEGVMVKNTKTYLQWRGTQPRCGSGVSVSLGTEK